MKRKSKTMPVLLAVFMVSLLVWSCEGPSGADGSGAYISVSPALASIAKGATADITATTNGVEDASYTWSSNDTDVATVSQGTVTGVSEGSALISVVGDNSGASAVVVIQVTPTERSEYSFIYDIQPMMTTDEFWSPGSDACTWCHYANNEDSLGSKHVMDLGSYEGIMYGADPDPDDLVGSGHPLFGESVTGQTDYDWDHAMLRSRIRNNRMPQAPGWEFWRNEGNRNGYDLVIGSDGQSDAVSTTGSYTSWGDEWATDNATGVPNALGMVEAWVEDLKAGGDLNVGGDVPFSYGGRSDLTFNNDVLQFFTQPDMWFTNSQECTECHFANIDESYHLMDVSNYDGFIYGADGGEHPLLNGETTALESTDDIDWSESRLRKRLRDNRMPPNSHFLLSEENRDGPDVWDAVQGEMVTAIDLIGLWLAAGAPE